MSDGTPYLRFLDPKSFREIKRIQVTDEAGHPVQNLNELEYIHGDIYETSEELQRPETDELSKEALSKQKSVDSLLLIAKAQHQKAGPVRQRPFQA